LHVADEDESGDEPSRGGRWGRWGNLALKRTPGWQKAHAHCTLYIARCIGY